jgi:hypothetical protein
MASTGLQMRWKCAELSGTQRGNPAQGRSTPCNTSMLGKLHGRFVLHAATGQRNSAAGQRNSAAGQRNSAAASMRTLSRAGQAARCGRALRERELRHAAHLGGSGCMAAGVSTRVFVLVVVVCLQVCCREAVVDVPR